MTDIIPRFGFRVRIGAASELGARRTNLEDAFLVAPDLGVLAVADGMGGTERGELAAQAAIDEVRVAMGSETSHRIAAQYCENPNLEARRLALGRLTRVVQRANQRVLEVARGLGESHPLGTTLDIAWLLRDEVFLAHVGDGRGYLVRSNAILQLTEDHSEPVTQSTPKTPTSTKVHTLSRLVNALGIRGSVVPDTMMLELRRSDYLVLASDGVWSALSGEADLSRLVRGRPAADAAASLVREAKERSFDDRTALVLEIVDRFVRHHSADSDALARDIQPVAESAIFAGISWPRIFMALSAAVNVEFAPSQDIPFRMASDWGAYILLDGMVRSQDGRYLGRGATLYAECLVGCEPRDGQYRALEQTRALRIRRDDFHEICASDPTLASELFRRLAEHLARRLSQ